MTHQATDHDLIEAMPAAVLVLYQGLIVHLNPACVRLLEAGSAQELLGRPVTEFVHSMDQAQSLHRLQRLQPGDDANLSTQIRMLTCKGNFRTLLVNSAPVRYHETDAIVVTAMDMSDQSAMEERLRVSEQNFRRLFENMQDVYYRTNAQGVVQMVGPGVRRVLGYEPHDIIGRTAESYYPQSSDRDAFKKVIQEKGEASDFPGQMVRADGQIIDISISSHALYDDSGAFCGIEGIYRDVTQRKNLERELQRLATVDSLTGIANRRAFMEQAAQAFSSAQRYPSDLAVLALDLDHFKSINDRHGHAAGDEVLTRFTQAVNTELRESDLFGRLGGEEFCIVLPHADQQKSRQVADRICANMQDLRFQDASGQFYTATVSIGIALKRASDRHVLELIERGDKALYQAKRSGRNQVVGDS